VKGRYLHAVTGLPFDLQIIETMRDLERQRYYVKIGASQTLQSKHLPQAPNNLSLAIDCCPVEYLAVKGWASGGDLWDAYGIAMVSAGLLWGGNWRTFVDKPHVYLDECVCQEAE
jgi:peptidoglycan L-alanyl-D-glutamate endopeptidase CwlK